MLLVADELREEIAKDTKYGKVRLDKGNLKLDVPAEHLQCKE